jgi:DNA-binding transcriptional LysR family regulator
MWETVELRDLRVFLTLADELHFRRTAERLDLKPSPVSQTIRELEHKLGAQLVYRTSRRVRLTAFGERLRSEARPAYEQLTGVLESTHAAARNLEGTLRLGLFSAPAGGPHLLALVDAFDKLHPECTLEVTQLSWDDPFASGGGKSSTPPLIAALQALGRIVEIGLERPSRAVASAPAPAAAAAGSAWA